MWETLKEEAYAKYNTLTILLLVAAISTTKLYFDQK